MKKASAICSALLSLSLSVSAAEYPSGRSVFAGMQRKGVAAGVQVRKRNKSWLETKADLGFALGMKWNSDLTYSNGDVEDISVTANVFPRVGASAFLSIPYGILKYFGLGLGVQGYYYKMEFRSREANRNWTAKGDGVNYNFTVPLINVGLGLPLKSGRGAFSIEGDMTAWIGGPSRRINMEFPGTGSVGTINTHPITGMHSSLTLHYYWR
jgi:hypothetical protein